MLRRAEREGAPPAKHGAPQMQRDFALRCILDDCRHRPHTDPCLASRSRSLYPQPLRDRDAPPFSTAARWPQSCYIVRSPYMIDFPPDLRMPTGGPGATAIDAASSGRPLVSTKVPQRLGGRLAFREPSSAYPWPREQSRRRASMPRSPCGCHGCAFRWPSSFVDHTTA
jgi:hypothetical protein